MADTSGGEFIAGFLVGALVGAAAALLLAPQSGEQTRTLIRDRSLELGQRADELSAEARRRAEELQAEARERARQVQSQAKERAGQLQDTVKQAVEEGKAAAEEKRQALLSQLEEEQSPEEAEA
jgi:gas vesicle protein